MTRTKKKVLAKSYTVAEKRRFVRMWAQFDKNYSRTCRELKKQKIPLAIPTLKNYVLKYSHEVDTDNLPAKFEKKINESLDKRLNESLDRQTDTLIQHATEVYEMCFDRMKELIPQEKNLSNVIFGLKTLHEILTPSRNETTSSAETLIDQINKHLSKKSENPSKNKTAVKDKKQKLQINEQESYDDGDIQDIAFELVR